MRAIFAFGVGYKLGERYKLGELEERRGRAADADAWQLGYDLSTRRYAQAYGSPQSADIAVKNEFPAEVIRDTTIPGAWRVEKLDSDGDGGIDVTIFDGPNAEQRAREYKAWKYGSR